ncbi:MAG TPA: circadian clock protein KaiC [Wenzhouxiangellaceae bacterium]|nr:circadian clock protein KaiC [Wenzhouxiangellaceae bacterium]
MKDLSDTGNSGIEKIPTGIQGFDELLGGGLPAGRTTLMAGGPGAGKTVMTLQALVHGARELGEPGIFVAFEESAARLKANAASFGWNLSQLQDQRLFFLDAQPQPEWVQSGRFDLNGLLAGLDQRVQDMGARRIVFDAIDVVLALMDDRRSIQQQVHLLNNWLAERELTAFMTYKLGAGSTLVAQLEFLQFMVDCSIRLSHEMIDGVAHRSVRVIKYRGASFEENPAPFVIGENGMQVALSKGHEEPPSSISTERVSSGVEALDAMLGGGYFRGAGILLTGAPGTAKTTLGGAFSKAACERGEKTLFVSFDSRAEELVRNLQSVNIDLSAAIDEGLLRMVTARSVSGSAESHLMKIQREAVDHQARCLVIDPVSALAKRGNNRFAHSVVERLVDWAKNQGLTLLCSSLVDRDRTALEGTPLQVSTIADTWIHLDYQEAAGERNRGLSIIKSRGTGHSNQVREILLSDGGVDLAEVYTAGGKVLMGALRYEKEREEQARHARHQKALERQRLELDAETAELEARLDAITRKLKARQRERQALLESDADQSEKATETSRQVRRMRGGDELSDAPERQDG